jgi:hypothetical protein
MPFSFFPFVTIAQAPAMWKSFFANQLAAAIWKIIHRFRLVNDENYLERD